MGLVTADEIRSRMSIAYRVDYLLTNIDGALRYADPMAGGVIYTIPRFNHQNLDSILSTVVRKLEESGFRASIQADTRSPTKAIHISWTQDKNTGE